MRLSFIIITLLIYFLMFGCQTKTASELEQYFPVSFQISVKNPIDVMRLDEKVILQLKSIQEKYPDFNPNAFVVLSGDKEVASQKVDSNADGQIDQIIFMLNIDANGSLPVSVRYAKTGEQKREYIKRTQAELSHKVGGKFEDRKYLGGEFKNIDFLRVPPEHTDHSSFIRYEGPGWESDKVGYRYYLDWRNATDIFGKKSPAMVLQQVGLDGFDSYHEMSDWGMDILKVGESLGIGSIAMWDDDKANRVAVTDSITCRISANGAIYSQITTNYFGWQIGGKKHDLTSNLSITAGSRMTKYSISVTNNPKNLCTGIVKHEETKILSGNNSSGEWNYFATFGKQSLAEDNLGMAILYKNSDFIEQNEDKNSHVTVLNVIEGQLNYYFLAAWEKEPNGIKTIDEFLKYLELETDKINNPLNVQF